MLEAINTTPQPVILKLPYLVKYLVKADAPSLGAPERIIYFEASKEGVEDREGEDIAQEALWRSRGLFLRDGNIDINHWSWLGAPYGTAPRPEYVIGLPRDVKKQGTSLFVEAEVFSSKTPPPPNSNGDWANWFWHGLTELQPPLRWSASVFGSIKPGGVKTKALNGKVVRYITDLEWFSVGLAQRAQNPDLQHVSATPIGPFAKAAGLLRFQPQAARERGALVMDLPTFGKALTVGAPVTDSALKTGVQALTPESLGKRPYRVIAKGVLQKLLTSSTVPSARNIAALFAEAGCDAATARRYAERLLREVALRR